MVRVFAYQADPGGRSSEAIAEEAFAICTATPRDAAGEDLTRRYYQRELRSLSFPGKLPCVRGRIASTKASCCADASNVASQFQVASQTQEASTR